MPSVENLTLSFELSEDQILTRRIAREFCEKKIAPKAPIWDKQRQWPSECLSKMAEMGYMGLFASKEFGGQDVDLVTAGIIHEELGKADCNCGVILYVHNISVRLLQKIASKDLKGEWLEKLAKGEKLVGLALTEPGCGSDFASITTSATKRDRTFFVSGEKSFITGAAPGGLDLFTSFVRTGPMEARHRAISALLVDVELEGIERYELEGMGLRGNKFGGMRFNDARIPDKCLIGEENKGFYYIMEHFDPGRALLALVEIGAAERALELAADYVKQRKTFGKPLAKYEEIQFKLAKGFMDIEAAKLLCYKTLWLADRVVKDELVKLSAMAKWFGTETSIRTVDEVMQIFGAVGYTTEYHVERIYRDVRGFGWADGSTEIMKIIAAREILGKEYLPYR